VAECSIPSPDCTSQCPHRATRAQNSAARACGADTFGQKDLRWNKMHGILSRLRAEGKQISCSNARNSSWCCRIFSHGREEPYRHHRSHSDALHAQPLANLKKGLAFVEKAARRGAHIVCLPELFRSLYFVRRRTTASLRSPNRFQAPRPPLSGDWPADAASRSSVPSSRSGRPASTIIPPSSSVRTAARGQVPQDAHPGRSTVL